MEVKGRITKAGPLEQRQKKDGTGTYTMFQLEIQIGLAKRVVADYATQSFKEEQVADTIGKTFFHDDAREAEKKYRNGELVMVKFRHYINQYGRTEVVIDEVNSVNMLTETDDLPF